MSWRRIRGHEALIRSFADIIQRGRLGQAYLFIGPAGVGKRMFARELAKALLCETPPPGQFEACDHCPSCALVEAGTHPDLLHASRPEDKNDLPIDVIRELAEQLSLRPARGSWKVALLDDADDLSDVSANCFLKTLEEPPPKSILILLATDLERQLSTIISRCQIVRFAPLPRRLIAEMLREQGRDPAKADRLARVSGGSLGQAQSLGDDELWDFRRDMLAELSHPRPDTVGLAKRLIAFAESAGKDTASHRRRASIVLRLLIDVLQSALGVSAGAADAQVESDELESVRTLADRFGTDGLLRLVERCLDADYHIDRRAQLVLALEAVIDAFAAAAAQR